MMKVLQTKIQSLNHLILWALLVLPAPCFAATLESVINKTVLYLQGTLVRAIGVAVIVVTGYLCLFLQKFPKEQFLMVLIGLGIIFGASSIYSTIAS